MLKIEPSVKTVDFLHLSNKLPNMCTIFNSLRLTKFKFWSLSLHIWHKVHFNQEIKLCKLFLYIFPLVQWLQFFWNLNFQSHSSTSDFVSSSWKLNNQYYTINKSFCTAVRHWFFLWISLYPLQSRWQWHQFKCFFSWVEKWGNALVFLRLHQ